MSESQRFANESELQEACFDLARSCGFWVMRMGNNSKRGRYMAKSGEDGMLDSLLPAYGWIEVKMPGEELNENQRKFVAKLDRDGVPWAVAETPEQFLYTAIKWRGEREQGRAEREWERVLGR